MATTNMIYTNPQKQNASKIDNSNRFKINKDVIAMMARNPSLGVGYLIGSALGENYFGKKRNKSAETAVNEAYENLYGSVPGNGSGLNSTDWDQANKILDAYNGGPQNATNTASVADAMKQQDGWALPPNQMDLTPPAQSAAPLTPQQANTPAITLDNAGTMGGVPTMQDAWANMQNAATYNNGNTGLFTNGIRNMDNVITAGTGRNLNDIALEEILKNPPTKQYF